MSTSLRQRLEPWGDVVETHSRHHPRFQLNNNNLLGMAANEVRRLIGVLLREDTKFTTDQDIGRWPLVTEFVMTFEDADIPQIKCILRPEASGAERQLFEDAMLPLLNGLHRSTCFKTLRAMAMNMTARLNEQFDVQADEDMPYFIRKIVAERSSGFVNYTVYFNYNQYPYVQTFQVRGTKVTAP